jgi:hypothetical protein
MKSWGRTSRSQRKRVSVGKDVSQSGLCHNEE